VSIEIGRFTEMKVSEIGNKINFSYKKRKVENFTEQLQNGFF
jgi:hypothetical protein